MGRVRPSTPALANEINWDLPSSSSCGATGIPRRGGSWTNLTISLANFGERARSPGFVLVLGLAAGAEKEVECLATLWADNVNARVPCNIYEQHMRHIGRFDASHVACCNICADMLFIYVVPKCSLPL